MSVQIYNEHFSRAEKIFKKYMEVSLSSIYYYNEKNQIDKLIRYPFCRMPLSLHILMQQPRTFTLPDCPLFYHDG